jgi:16S rRNA (cytosine1402-N4)-methyltransferase
VASPFTHQPVLLDESLEFLELRGGAVIVDGTLGGGGHAAAILERTAPDGRLIGLDLDEDALAAATVRLAPLGDRFRGFHASFAGLGEILSQLGRSHVDGVLLDLGVSSPQLDEPERGFRFAEATADTTPLDMRMDPSTGATAADLLRRATPVELEAWFRDYGELPGARRLARAIVEERRREPIRTARDLLRIIDGARIGRGRVHHPATLVFQALRIAVNDEVRNLEAGIEAAIDALGGGGRLVVIAYHSIEDRIVKNRLRDAVRGCVCPPRTPVCICGQTPRLRVLTRRPVSPSAGEVRANPRSRSARLRAAERLPEAA